MARRRVKVGTLIGTEDRNDDDLIARTPPMRFGPPPSPIPIPTETTSPADRVDNYPADPGVARDGDGSGSNGPSGGSTPGSRGTSLADFTEQAISAVSDMDPGAAPPGMAKGIGMVSDMLNEISSEAFGTFGEKPGLGMQTKSQATGTVAQAKSKMGNEEEEDTTATPSAVNKGYAPPSPPAYNEQEKGFQADTNSEAAQAAQAAESAAPAGVAGSAQNAPGEVAGTDTGKDKGTTGDDGDGGEGGASGGGEGPGGGGTGGATGGEGPSGDSSGGGVGGTGTGGGAFKEGVIDIEGPDPSKKGEAIPDVTLHEGETVLTDAETTLIGEKALKRVRQIAADKNTRLAQRSRAAKSTLLSAARG